MLGLKSHDFRPEKLKVIAKDQSSYSQILDAMWFSYSFVHFARCLLV